MGRRSTGAMLAVLVTVLLCGNAVATTMDWKDIYDIGDVLLGRRTNSFHYDHDITDVASGSFNPNSDFVTSYNRKIALIDDERHDGCEIAYINQPGLLGDVFYNFNYYSPFGWSISGRSMLNDTGHLAIDIFAILGDFYFVSSELTAYGCRPEPQSVPEPSGMLVLGLGLFGLAGFARKRFKS